MHLKALRLHGFKSFADPIVLRFEPGVTAIVGPNGCGKSNMADAVRWVLGEQSAKTLRGGSMQDVIFEGTDTRKPHNLCEIALLLTECEEQLGTDYHEIEIMRRVSRDGQSEYFLNGQACRLKDIHKLFMDTGVGRTSYSIMAQGQIDQVLSSKPEDRRAVFEEAAGITRYKSQRREALAKLELTEQNLARVTDVIAEVGRQIGSLRRQASKAMRYKRLSFRLRHLSLADSGRQWGELQAVLAGLDARVAALRAETDARRAALEARRGELNELKARRGDHTRRVQEAQQAVFDLRSEKEQAENQAGLARIKQTGLQERIQAGGDDIAELEMQLREVTAQADSGAQDRQFQLERLGRADAVFQERNRELGVVEGELSRLEQQLAQAKGDLLQLEGAVARLRAAAAGSEVEARTSQLRHDELAVGIDEIRRTQAAAAALAGEEQQRLETARADQSRAHNEVHAAQTELQDVLQRHREAQRRLQDIDRALAQRTARLRLLQQLHEKWEGFGEGAKALLQGRLEGALAGLKVTPISRGLEVKTEFGPAVEALLGSAAEAVSVADLAAARQILAQLEERKIGSACLQIREAGGGRRETVKPAGLPAFLRPATAALVNPDPAHPAAALLASCYIADDLNAFLEFWRAAPDFDFLLVATPKGELVDRRGLVCGGHLKRPAGGIVQREIELREAARELAGDQKLHDDQRALIEKLAAGVAEAEAALEQRRKDVLAVAQQVAAVQAEARNADKGLEETSGRLERLERELGGLHAVRTEAEQRLARARAGLGEAEQKLTVHKDEIATTENRVAALRLDRDQKKEALAQARLELAECRQKVEVLDRGLGEMARQRAQMDDLLTQRRQEIEVWTEQAAELDREAAAQQARAGEVARTLAIAQQSVETVRGELDGIERQIAAVEQSQQGLHAQADAAQEELGRCEVQFAESRTRAQFLAEEVQREFQTDLATVDWKLMLWRADDEPPDLRTLDLDEEEDTEGGDRRRETGEPVAEVEAKPKPQSSRRKTKKQKGAPTEADLAAFDQTNWDQVRADLEGLRQRLTGMGAVNLVAIEEYAELRQRFDFLKTQSDDLTGAKAELLKAIDEINRASQQQFETTFEQVKKNFEYTFQALFGGGHARLELVQAADILESGIEIIAQPPGTRLKGISLLSGGQKTLTAVALLFALFMVKPSPFCVLDELDAPLDESNIGRFTKLLKHFTANSQFLIITHNKRTIAAAHAIYGVTMEERGVSKVVSMRFNRERGEAETVGDTVADAVRATRPAEALAALQEPVAT